MEQISPRIHPDHKAVLETSLLVLSPDTIVSLLPFSSPLLNDTLDNTQTSVPR